MLNIPYQAAIKGVLNLSWNSVKQRQQLVDILLTKDDRALLRVIKILETRECGYADLAKEFFAQMDAMQKARDKEAASE